MNVWKLAFLCCFVSVLPAMGESFLSAQSFPKTFDDLSFTAKMELKGDDYELYRPVYDDATGVCIENCAYPGLTLKQEMEIDERNTKAALEKSEQYEKQTQTLPIDTQNIVSNISGNSYVCANRNPNIRVGQKVPRSEPLIGTPKITSPYGPRRLEGKQSKHDGIDYRAAVGTTVYAPADGRVVNVWNDARCGNGVKLEHEDGTKTIYCHLDKALVVKGTKIGAGCPIAQTGNTGHSTGPHLHYAMLNEKGESINPANYTGRAN